MSTITLDGRCQLPTYADGMRINAPAWNWSLRHSFFDHAIRGTIATYKKAKELYDETEQTTEVFIQQYYTALNKIQV
jgi:hypothetical protein